MSNHATEAMLHTLKQYQTLKTFDRENDPTGPILVGTLHASRDVGIDVSEHFRGIALAYEMRMEARHNCLALKRGTK